MVTYPAALDLSHALVEWVTMLIVTREGDRRCKLPPHQRALVALYATLAANRARARRSRVIKRLRKGRSLPADAPDLVVGDPHDVEDWYLESDVLERVGRQLRSIGDAMAWRAFRYDRRYVFALRRNESPGPMTLSKVGTVHEIQFAEQQWIENRSFAPLNDITDCLRIGDVTVFRDRDDDEQDILLYEPKADRQMATSLVG